MEKVIEVPGVGNVSFPDTMSDDKISAAIQKSLPRQQSGPDKPVFGDARSYGQVAIDQLKDVGKGAMGMVTGIPAMASQGASAISDMLTGKGSQKAQDMISGTASSLVQPITTSVRGLGALVSPDSVTAPSSDEFSQAAQGAVPTGLALIGTEAPISGLINKVKSLRGQMAPGIFNAKAGVKAGRQGVQVSPTGEPVINPGNASVRAGASLTDNVKTMAVKNARELESAGKALSDHLGKADTAIDLTDVIASAPDELKFAARKSGIKASVDKPSVEDYLAGKSAPEAIQASAQQVHDLRSNLGHDINWNPNVYTEGNEALKRSYAELSNLIDQAVPGTKPFNTRWQEAFLNQKALQHTIAKEVASPAYIRAAQTIAAHPLRTAGVLGGAGLGYELWKSH